MKQGGAQFQSEKKFNDVKSILFIIFNIIEMMKVSNFLLSYHLFLILFTVIPNSQQQSPFCASQCADYTNACFGPGENDCYACSTSLYLLQRNSSGVCQLSNQTQILFNELKNSGLTLNGYSSSKPTPNLCGTYYMSGEYVAGDFLQKTFTNIPLNHYQLVIRFGVSFIGNWSSTDQIQLSANGYSYNWTYNYCHSPQTICSSFNNTDCMKIYQQVISHNSSNVTLRFTSSISEIDPLQQYWGIKDLIIGAKLCSSKCATCYGPGDADCITCAADYYLLGNLCVAKCQFFALTDKRLCVEECPLAYFQSGNSICSPCQPDCIVCTNSHSCDVWSNNKPGVVWENNKTFFILLIFILLLVVAYFIWKLVIKKYLKRKDFAANDIDKRMISDSHLNLDEESKRKVRNDKMKSSSSSSNSDEHNKGPDHQDYNESKIKNQSNDTKVLVFEDVDAGMKWNEEGPTIQQIIVSNPNNPQKRKKKKFRPNGSESAAVYPTSIELDGTIENLKL